MYFDAPVITMKSWDPSVALFLYSFFISYNTSAPGLTSLWIFRLCRWVWCSLVRSRVWLSLEHYPMSLPLLMF